MLTLGQLIASSRITQIENSDPTSQDFLTLVSESVKSLLDRGDWRATVAPVLFNARFGVITLPNNVESIRKMNSGNREVEVGNDWHRFVDHDMYHSFSGSRFSDDLMNYGINGHHSTRMLDSQGFACTYNDILTPSYLQIYPQSRNDIGKQITIYGLDYNGLRMRTRNADGTITDGCTLTIAAPYVQSSQVWAPQKLERIVKDKTQDSIRMYAVDAQNFSMLDLAVYLPYEVSPSYKRYCLKGQQTREFRNIAVMTMVKLKFTPISSPNDLILIESMEAIKLWAQGVKFYESGDVANGEACQAKALQALNRQLDNDAPDYQMAIENKTFGNTKLGRCRVW